jgi:hypothetical protein
MDRALRWRVICATVRPSCTGRWTLAVQICRPRVTTVGGTDATSARHAHAVTPVRAEPADCRWAPDCSLSQLGARCIVFRPFAGG